MELEVLCTLWALGFIIFFSLGMILLSGWLRERHYRNLIPLNDAYRTLFAPEVPIEDQIQYAVMLLDMNRAKEDPVMVRLLTATVNTLRSVERMIEDVRKETGR